MTTSKYDPDKIFDYLTQFVARYPGAFPTLREISAKFGMNSTSVARQRLKDLVKAGKLREYEKGRYYIPDMFCIYKGSIVKAEQLPSDGEHTRRAIMEYYRHIKQSIIAG